MSTANFFPAIRIDWPSWKNSPRFTPGPADGRVHFAPASSRMVQIATWFLGSLAHESGGGIGIEPSASLPTTVTTSVVFPASSVNRWRGMFSLHSIVK